MATPKGVSDLHLMIFLVAFGIDGFESRPYVMIVYSLSGPQTSLVDFSISFQAFLNIPN